MRVTGGCYCGLLRYESDGEFLAKAMCFCNECRHIAGGSASVIVAVPADQFSYTQGQPSQFTRTDLVGAATREFCSNCGTQILTRTPASPNAVLIKAGSLDDQSIIGLPALALYVSEKQPYHVVPEGVACFDKFPAPPSQT